MMNDDDLSEEERNEQATLHCSCKEGREYRAEEDEKAAIQQMIADGKSIAESLLSLDYPDVKDFVQDIIPRIVELGLDGIQLKFESTKVAIKYDGQTLTIKRIDTKQQKDEAYK